MMYSAYKLNKQGENIQPFTYSFPNLGTSLVLLLDLRTDFSGGRSGGLVFLSLEECSTVCCDPQSQGFGIVNKAEVDVFL